MRRRSRVLALFGASWGSKGSERRKGSEALPQGQQRPPTAPDGAADEVVTRIECVRTALHPFAATGGSTAPYIPPARRLRRESRRISRCSTLAESNSAPANLGVTEFVAPRLSSDFDAGLHKRGGSGGAGAGGEEGMVPGGRARMGRKAYALTGVGV